MYARENDLARREAELIGGLIEAVVDVYGEWAREIAVVMLIGVPDNRWGAATRAPRVQFGIKEAAFEQPDMVGRLAAGVTDALVTQFGEQTRAATEIEFVGTRDERTATGGVLNGRVGT
ncbi:hypothetical protein [Paractinoplanes lichenicola]|uniref:hypothetical protein n=1 Tax=Paractinoplanes lichenicola TaxID=2802976 RepID=UPI0027DC8CFD|nr:hypothetical protein [Actinoplanes lichenicola]